MSYKRGDVVLVIYPDSTLKTYKQRPALVVQADDITTGLPQRIVAMITSNLGRTGATRIPILQASPEGKSMGLVTDSVIVTDNLATVHETAIARAIGRCPITAQVGVALRKTLGL
ncbi:MAG TPA: type II toxin-antitoxin system PemK/MazF family toxin [Ktedonobacteraceae bacterium]|jgi:mRNA interferase MazF